MSQSIYGFQHEWWHEYWVHFVWLIWLSSTIFLPAFLCMRSWKNWIMLCKLHTTVVPGNMMAQFAGREESAETFSKLALLHVLGSWASLFESQKEAEVALAELLRWKFAKTSLLYFLHSPPPKRNAIPSINSFDRAPSTLVSFCVHSPFIPTSTLTWDRMWVSSFFVPFHLKRASAQWSRGCAGDVTRSRLGRCALARKIRWPNIKATRPDPQSYFSSR